jgi:hypothetical protein
MEERQRGGPPVTTRVAATRPAADAPTGAPIAPAKHIVFLIDISGSMTGQMAGVKDEVSKAIGELRDDQMFDLVFASDGRAIPLSPTLLAPSEENQRKAVSLLADVSTSGRNSLGDAIPVVTKLRPDLVWVVSDGPGGEEKTWAALRAAAQRGHFRVNTALQFIPTDALAPSARRMWQLAHDCGGTCTGRDGKVVLSEPKVIARSPTAEKQQVQPPDRPSIFREDEAAARFDQGLPAPGSKVYELRELVKAIPPEFSEARAGRANALERERYELWVQRHVVGQKMALTGKLSSDFTDGERWRVELDGAAGGGEVAQISCAFYLPKWRGRASTLKQGDELKVTGTIESVLITKDHVTAATLKECALD